MRARVKTRRSERVAALKGGFPAPRRSDVRISLSFPGSDPVAVEEGRKSEEPGMRPDERDWDCVKRPNFCSGEVKVAAVSLCRVASVSGVAIIIVGAMERAEAARVVVGPATEFMAREEWV